MKNHIIFLLLATLGALLFSGCYSYKHERVHISADGTETREMTYARSKFQDSSAGKISSRTTANDLGVYTREVGFEDISALTDEDSLRVIEEIAGSVSRGIVGGVSGGAGAALRGSAEPP